MNFLKGMYYPQQASQAAILQSHLCFLSADPSAVLSEKIDGVATEPFHSYTPHPAPFFAEWPFSFSFHLLLLPFSVFSLLVLVFFSVCLPTSCQICLTGVSTGWIPSCTCCQVWIWTETTAKCCSPPITTSDTPSPSQYLRYKGKFIIGYFQYSVQPMVWESFVLVSFNIQLLYTSLPLKFHLAHGICTFFLSDRVGNLKDISIIGYLRIDWRNQGVLYES